MNRSSFFRVVLVLVGLNAAIAIFALLGGDMGETGGQILLSSLTATMGAVLALMCAPAGGAGRAGQWPKVGIAAAVVSSAMLILGIWTEPGDEFFQAAASVLVLAVTAALICLLSAWPGRGGLVSVHGAARALTFIAGTMIVIAIWAGGDLPGGYWRGFGVVMVLMAAAAIATPVVHRMAAPTEPVALAHCPFDGSPVAGTVGRRVTCPQCGRKYEVNLRG